MRISGKASKRPYRRRARDGVRRSDRHGQGLLLRHPARDPAGGGCAPWLFAALRLGTLAGRALVALMLIPTITSAAALAAVQGWLETGDIPDWLRPVSETRDQPFVVHCARP